MRVFYQVSRTVSSLKSHILGDFHPLEARQTPVSKTDAQTPPLRVGRMLTWILR